MKVRDAMVDRPSIRNDRNQPNGPLGFITFRNNGGGRFSASSRSTGPDADCKPQDGQS